MPSGKPVSWEVYDHFIVTYLPTMTIEEFAKTHLPQISAKAVGARARKLGIKPASYKPTANHKEKIGRSIAKIGDLEVVRIRELRDTHSVAQIAILLGVDELTVHRAIAKHGIIIQKLDVSGPWKPPAWSPLARSHGTRAVSCRRKRRPRSAKR